MKDQTNRACELAAHRADPAMRQDDEDLRRRELLLSKYQEELSNSDSDKDSGFSQNYDSKPNEPRVYPDEELDEDDEEEELIERIWAELEEIPEERRRSWMLEQARTRIHRGKEMPRNLLELTAARFFHGDSGASVDSKPGWLDDDKFSRGQRFAREHVASISYANLLSLFALYSFKHDLNPIIASGNSSTPYTSFKRYLSTSARVINWYLSDPWTAGSGAYADIRAVRRLHSLVRKRTAAMSRAEYAERTSIREPWCPALDIVREDFRSACPAPAAPSQCPFDFLNRCQGARDIFLSQSEMAGTQFGFVGLVVLKPEYFGIHYASDDDLEAFLHVWRAIGYLLGIEDDYNFCRGSLEEVRARSRDFLEYWVKPNLRTITPEWEHMMRCIFQGIRYYYPGALYETALLDLGDFLNLKMTRVYSTLTYGQWFRRLFMRFYLNFALRFDKFRVRLNYFFQKKVERAIRYDAEKHEELQRRSTETLESYAKSKEVKPPNGKAHSE